MGHLPAAAAGTICAGMSFGIVVSHVTHSG